VKIWTALQHSSGLLAALGLFFAISAYSNDSGSRPVAIGLLIAVLGLVGFFAGRILAKRSGR